MIIGNCHFLTTIVFVAAVVINRLLFLRPVIRPFNY